MQLKSERAREGTVASVCLFGLCVYNQGRL